MANAVRVRALSGPSWRAFRELLLAFSGEETREKNNVTLFVLKAPEMGARARHLRRSRVLSRVSNPS